MPVQPAVTQRRQLPPMFAWCTNATTVAAVVVVLFFVALLIAVSRYAANEEQPQKAQPHANTPPLRWIPSR